VRTNILVNGLTFDYLQKKISLNITVPSRTEGFANFPLQQTFLKGPYNVSVDTQTVGTIGTDLANESSVSCLSEGLHTVEITATDVVVLEFQPCQTMQLQVVATLI
jgi:hypothetical protein